MFFENSESFGESIKKFFNQIGSVIEDIDVVDILDILLVAFVIYSAIKLIRDTRAIQIIKGLLLLFLAFAIISVLDMQASSYILNLLFKDLVIVFIILFQPEIRHALENMGRSSLKRFPFVSKSELEKDEELVRSALVAVCRSSNYLSKNKIGALMVFERKTLLGDVVATGTILDATVSQELIGNVFYPKSPLHDGAAIVRNGKLYAAGCILPLTQSSNLNSALGTRHRAAIGMSEQSDAIVVVISEETGTISIAQRGYLERNISEEVLLNKLQNALIPEAGKRERKRSKDK